MLYIRRNIRWILVALWACFILYMSSFSTPPGDLINRTSGILKSLELTLPSIGGRSQAFTIGKIGHVLEYALLSLLIFTASWGPLRRRLEATMGIGIIIAIADETRQYFVPGREGCVRDVFIDMLGLAVGVTLALGLKKTYAKYVGRERAQRT